MLKVVSLPVSMVWVTVPGDQVNCGAANAARTGSSPATAPNTSARRHEMSRVGGLRT